MAKELPFFKFEPSQWDNGNIQLCSWEAKGIFISLCSMYWQRLGDLPYKLAVQKVCNGNATALDSLCEEKVITVIDGLICIDFLNEQLSEFENISQTNSENARSGWEKRRNKATAMPSQSDRNARREEKRRGDKIKEDNIFIDQPVIFGTGLDFIIVLPKELHSKKYRIQGADGLRLYYEENTSVLRSPEKASSFMAKFSGGQYNDFMHVFNTYNKFIDQQQNGRKNTNSAELIDPNKKYAGKL